LYSCSSSRPTSRTSRATTARVVPHISYNKAVGSPNETNLKCPVICVMSHHLAFQISAFCFLVPDQCHGNACVRRRPAACPFALAVASCRPLPTSARKPYRDVRAYSAQVGQGPHGPAPAGAVHSACSDCHVSDSPFIMQHFIYLRCNGVVSRNAECEQHACIQSHMWLDGAGVCAMAASLGEQQCHPSSNRLAELIARAGHAGASK